jgi:hypothetical protein
MLLRSTVTTWYHQGVTPLEVVGSRGRWIPVADPSMLQTQCRDPRSPDVRVSYYTVLYFFPSADLSTSSFLFSGAPSDDSATDPGASSLPRRATLPVFSLRYVPGHLVASNSKTTTQGAERPKAAQRHPPQPHHPHQRLSEETFGYSEWGFQPARVALAYSLARARKRSPAKICHRTERKSRES